MSRTQGFLIGVIVLAVALSMVAGARFAQQLNDRQAEILLLRAEIATLTKANQHLGRVLGNKREYIEAGCLGRYQGEE